MIFRSDEDDLLKHPECREAAADQAFAYWIFSQKVSDLQDILAGVKNDSEARRIRSELEDIVNQAVICLAQNVTEVFE